MTAAELLRSVTRALTSNSDDDALAALPGTIVRGDAGVIGFDGGTLSIPVPGVGALLIETGEPDDDLRAAAESVASQIALFWSVRDMEARRRAMLEVAFDSVVTMNDRGVALSANRAAERLFGYTAAEMVGREVAELIIPPSLREAHRSGLERYLRTGRGPVVGRRVELTAMRADGSEFPVELVVTRPDVPGGPVFYGYLRDLTARYVAEAALHRLADEQAALRRVATAVAAEHESSRLFALVSEEVGRLLEARTAHMFRFDPDGSGGAIIGGWGLRAEHVLPPGTRMTLDGDTAVTRVWRTGRAARMDSYESAEGELAAQMREYGVQGVVAAPIFLGDTSRCCAPSCRLRSSRRRSASPAATMRARDAASSSRACALASACAASSAKYEIRCSASSGNGSGSIDDTTTAPQSDPPSCASSPAASTPQC